MDVSYATFPTVFGPIYGIILVFRLVWTSKCKMVAGGHIEYLKTNGHENLSNATFHTKCGVGSPLLASMLHFDESRLGNLKWLPAAILKI